MYLSVLWIEGPAELWVKTKLRPGTWESGYQNPVCKVKESCTCWWSFWGFLMHVRLCKLMGENTMALTTVFLLGCSQDWSISWSFPSTSVLHILQCPSIWKYSWQPSVHSCHWSRTSPAKACWRCYHGSGTQQLAVGTHWELLVSRPYIKINCSFGCFTARRDQVWPVNSTHSEWGNTSPGTPSR